MKVPYGAGAVYTLHQLTIIRVCLTLRDTLPRLIVHVAASAHHHPSIATARSVVMPSPGTSGQSTPYDANQANAQMALIDFDPTALGFDPNTILDSQAPFDWEVYLSEMYNEGNLFMN